MHLLIALKCPSSRSLFCLRFYLESRYNLCRAIRFLSSGCGRSGSVEQGKEPGVSRGRGGSGSGMCPAHPSPALSTSLALKQRKIMEQKRDKTGKNPAWSLSLMGTVPIPPQDPPGGAEDGDKAHPSAVAKEQGPVHSWGNIWVREGTRGTLWGRDWSECPARSAAREGCHTPCVLLSSPQRFSSWIFRRAAG